MFVVTLQLQDSFGRKTTKRVETETDVLATAQTAVDGLLSDLAAITDLECVGAIYSYRDASDTFAGEATSNIDQGATFRLRLADGAQTAYKVPGFPLSKVGAGGIVDTTDADVVAFFDNFLAAGDFTVSDGEAITAIEAGSLDV